MLLDNGFTPEWIQLSKEIREDIANLKKRLGDVRNQLGEAPLCNEDRQKWEDTLKDVMAEVKRINKNVDKYNLIVPILQKQMLQVNLKSLADAALANPPYVEKNATKQSDTRKKPLKSPNESDGILQVLTYYFSNK